MPENIYEKLRELLDTHPVGCAPAPEMIEILKILFTEEEAKVAVGLGFTAFSVDEIAHRSGVPPEEAGRYLESMANKGLVFAREKNGKSEPNDPDLPRSILVSGISLFDPATDAIRLAQAACQHADN